MWFFPWPTGPQTSLFFSLTIHQRRINVYIDVGAQSCFAEASLHYSHRIQAWLCDSRLDSWSKGGTESGKESTEKEWITELLNERRLGGCQILLKVFAQCLKSEDKDLEGSRIIQSQKPSAVQTWDCRKVKVAVFPCHFLHLLSEVLSEVFLWLFYHLLLSVLL